MTKYVVVKVAVRTLDGDQKKVTDISLGGSGRAGHKP